MRRALRLSEPALAAVLALAFLWTATPSALAFSISAPATYDASDPLTLLPGGGTGTVSLNPAAITHLNPPGMGSNLFTTFAADAPTQYTGWTITQGATLNGSMAINLYIARDCPTDGSGGPPKQCGTVINPAGGAGINATFTPDPNFPPTPTTLRFLQMFIDNTGAGGATVRHIDPFPNDDPNSLADPNQGLPWYWTESEHATNSTATTMTFLDFPADHVSELPFNRTVRFELYLSSFNTGTKVATVHDGFSWGYDVVAVPEPSAALLVGFGLAALAFARRRADRSSRGP
jgi:hypothetical protein